MFLVALGGDTRSAKQTQQGRLPGSVNVKPGKGHVVYLLHSSVQNLDEAVFLEITSKDSLHIEGDIVSPVVKAPARSASGPDQSRADWRMCCSYFEKYPSHSVERALADLQKKFLARRPNQGYYEALTVRKARDKVVNADGGASSSSVPAKSPQDEAQLPHTEGVASRAPSEPEDATVPTSVASSGFLSFRIPISTV